MPITTQQKKLLKAKAHSLRPIVFTGLNGFTENLKKEIDRALNDHELIKIRIQENDREVRHELFQEICMAVSAESVQLIGSIGIMYRKNPAKHQPTLPVAHKNPSTKKNAAKLKRAKKRQKSRSA